VATGRPLHEMVSLPVDASADELRRAYEAAMSDATRTGAHQRAVNLSKAFDELSAARRQAVYARHDLPRNRSAVAAPVFTRPRRGRRRIERILALVLLPVIVIASVIVTIHHGDSARSPATGPSSPTISISAPAPSSPVLPAAPAPVGDTTAN
jgi:hypothetical protein